MNNGRSKIINKFGKLHISIPSKKNWVVLLFGSFWLTGWYVGVTYIGEKVMENIQTDSFDILLLVWFTGWLIGGSSVMSMMLWGLFGKEKLVIDKETILIQKTVFGLGRRLRLSKDEIVNLREQQVCNSSFSGCKVIPFSNSIGKIGFDYGMRTYSFGLSLDQSEVKSLILKLENNFMNKYGFNFKKES